MQPGPPGRNDAKRVDGGKAGPGHRNLPGKARRPRVKELAGRHVLRKTVKTERLAELRMKGMQNPEVPRSIRFIPCSV